MAINTLNHLFATEKKIEALEIELKELRTTEKKLINQVLESGSMENRYYRLCSKTRKGDRVLNVVLLQEKYPDVYQACKVESVRVTDASRMLGDDIITELSVRKPDTVTYFVEKKISDVLEVA